MPGQRLPKLPPKVMYFFENELFRRIIRNSSYLFSATGISAFFSMIQGVLAARLLGVEMFGVLGTITMFVSVINKLASFRIGEMVVKYVSEYEEINDTQRAAAIFKIAMLIEILTSFVAFGLVLLLSPIGAKFFAKDTSLSNQFSFYGIIILFNLITESSTGLLQVSNRFQRLAGWNILQSFFTLVVITLAFIFDGDLTHVLIAYMTGKAIGAFGLLVNALREANNRWGKNWWKVNLNTLRPQVKELSHFAISTNLSSTISLVTKDSEILWVSLFRPNAEVGYYKLALALANMVQIPISSLPQVTYPELSREVNRKNWSIVRNILKQGSLLAGSYAIIATLVLVIIGKPLISLVYTQEYLPSYPALIILLLGYLIADIFYWRRIALLSFGQPDFPVKLNFTLSVLKISGAIALIPRYGYLASAGLLAAFYWFGSLISWFKVQQLLTKGQTTA